jgi:hypothetical protein
VGELRTVMVPDPDLGLLGPRYIAGQRRRTCIRYFNEVKYV